MKAVCVYCGSSPGRNPAFAAAAAAFGELLGREGIRLVYGGGHVGLMGVVADAALGAGAEVHGVITRALWEKEVAHTALTHLDVVETMHDRKALMSDQADAFVMLPGGFGTFDEFFEAVTWTQLGVHSKPCGVLNVDGFFDPLEAQLDAAVAERFVRPEHRGLLISARDPVTLLDRLRAWSPVRTEKWLDRTKR